MKNIVGLTLLELLTTLAIAAMLYFFALPALQGLQQRWQARQEISHLQLMLSSAREHAIFQQQRVTLCPLNPQQRCSTDWNQELSLFTDDNNNDRLDPQEQILSQFSASQNPKANRSFNNNALGFNSQGHAGFSTGSLAFCLNGRTTHAAVFIVSRSGRIRSSSSLNSGQLPMLANGNPIPCVR